jgi:hypothetical protein
MPVEPSGHSTRWRLCGAWWRLENVFYGMFEEKIGLQCLAIGSGMEKGRGRQEIFQGGASAHRVSQGAVVGCLDLGVVLWSVENKNEGMRACSPHGVASLSGLSGVEAWFYKGATMDPFT